MSSHVASNYYIGQGNSGVNLGQHGKLRLKFLQATESKMFRLYVHVCVYIYKSGSKSGRQQLA